MSDTRNLDEAREVLTRTPRLLDGWLRGLPDAWVRAQEGPDTWSAYDVVGHLVHGELTDWTPVPGSSSNTGTPVRSIHSTASYSCAVSMSRSTSGSTISRHCAEPV